MRRSYSKRKIIDMTARKCKDTMISRPLEAPGVPQGVAGSAAIISGDVVWGSAFAPHARPSSWTEGESEYARQKTRTYARGYKENISITTNDTTNWLWRRIVFHAKQRIWESFPIDTLEYNPDLPEAGQQRAIWNFQPAGGGEAAAALHYALFQGTRGVDWSNFFNAPTNKRFVNVLSDKVTKLEGTNGAPRVYNFRKWYPFNGTLIYNEKEVGGNKPSLGEQNKWSAQSMYGFGDIMIVDYFAAAAGLSTNELSFQCTGTYYWHEK